MSEDLTNTRTVNFFRAQQNIYFFSISNFFLSDLPNFYFIKIVFIFFSSILMGLNLNV